MKTSILYPIGLPLLLLSCLFIGCGLDTEGQRATGGTGSTGSSTGSSGSSSSGAGGGSSVCTPGEMLPCYDGPPNTQGIGICAPGLQTCGPDGMPAGECIGQVLPAPSEDCVSAIDSTCDGTTSPCTGKSLWGITFGSLYNDLSLGTAVDSQKNMIVAGFIGYKADIGGQTYEPEGATDMFIVKLSPTGEVVWVKTFGGTYDDKAYSVAVDAMDNIWVTGSFSNTVDFGFGPFVSAGGADIFLLKLNPLGDPELARRFGGVGEDTGLSIATGPDSVAIAGSFFFTLSFDSGAPSLTATGSDVFVADFGLDGLYRWSKSFGDGSPQIAWDLDVDGEGNVYVAGEMYGTVNFGGEDLKANGRDAFVVSLDSEGKYRYSRLLGGINDQAAWTVAADKDGGAYVGGSFLNDIDIDMNKHLSAIGWDAFVVRLLADGTPAWSFQFQSENVEKTIYDIEVDPFGNLLFTGSYYGKGMWAGMPLSSQTRDIMVGKLSAAGDPVWMKLLGDDTGYEQRGWGVASDADGFVYVAGAFDSGVTLVEGEPGHKTAGNADVFAVKLEP